MCFHRLTFQFLVYLSVTLMKSNILFYFLLISHFSGIRSKVFLILKLLSPVIFYGFFSYHFTSRLVTVLNPGVYIDGKCFSWGCLLQGEIVIEWSVFIPWATSIVSLLQLFLGSVENLWVSCSLYCTAFLTIASWCVR